MQKRLSLIILLTMLLSACTPAQVTETAVALQPKPYVSTTGSAAPGDETSVLLEDGAGMVIPQDALEAPVTILVERNPEKSAFLPPLPDGFLRLSDFYNYTVTSGELIGPVDLIMPFDASLLPDGEGELVALIPTADGWNISPISVEGSTATLYTNEYGDPLIGWDFYKWKEGVNKEYDPNRPWGMHLDCQKSLTINLSPTEGDFATEYHLLVQYNHPSGKNANTPLTFEFNYWVKGISGNVQTRQTNENGFYDLLIVPENNDLGFREGLNSVKVHADCGNGNFVDKYYNWRLERTPVATPTSAPTATETTTTQQMAVTQVIATKPVKVPAGAVQLPDFTGKPVDEAIAWLKSKGFNYLSVDGSSTYDVGMVYSQSPAGGTYHVPHRTSVVLYRTVETLADPCAGTGLTPEECVNVGKHEYQLVEIVTGAPGIDPTVSCRDPINEVRILEVSFSNSTATILRVSNVGPLTFNKTETNTYFNDKDSGFDYALTFNTDGFIIIQRSLFRGKPGSCTWVQTHTILKP